MKIKHKTEIEAEADDLVKIIDHAVRILADLRSGKADSYSDQLRSFQSRHLHSAVRSSAAPSTIVPDAPWAQATPPLPTSTDDAPRVVKTSVLSKEQERLAAEGADVWHGLALAWLDGFGEERAHQPDRVSLFRDVMNENAGPVFACLRASNNDLTRLIQSVLPTKYTKAQARRLAENIAQVTSALGYPEFSNALLYTPEYTSKEYNG